MGLEISQPGFGPAARERALRPWHLAAGALVSAAIAVMGMWGLVGYVTAHAPIGTGCGNTCATTLTLGSAKAMSAYNSSGKAYFPYGTVVERVSPHVPVDQLNVSLTTPSGRSASYAYAGVTSGSSGCWVGNDQSGWTSGMPVGAAPGSTSCGASGPSISDPVSPGDTIVVATNSPEPSLGASISVHTGTTTVNAVLP